MINFAQALALTRDLGGTTAAPTVVGLQGLDLPTFAANGFLKKNSGNSAFEQVAYGQAANTVAQGNDGRFLAGNDVNEVCARSVLAITSNAAALSNGLARFLFMGRVTKPNYTPKFIALNISSAGTVATVNIVEMGLFTSSSPPNKQSQTMTCKAFTSFALGGVPGFDTVNIKRNSTAFSTSFNVGDYLWAGVRCGAYTTQPNATGAAGDYGAGNSMFTTSAAVFAVNNAYSAVVDTSGGSAAVGPFMTLELV